MRHKNHFSHHPFAGRRYALVTKAPADGSPIHDENPHPKIRKGSEAPKSRNAEPSYLSPARTQATTSCRPGLPLRVPSRPYGLLSVVPSTAAIDKAGIRRVFEPTSDRRVLTRSGAFQWFMKSGWRASCPSETTPTSGLETSRIRKRDWRAQNCFTASAGSRLG